MSILQAKCGAANGSSSLWLGSLLLTEADLTLTEKVHNGLPGMDVQAVWGSLDIASMREADDITALWVTVRSAVGRAEMEALPNLRIIATASAGYDHIDLAAARERGIAVCNVPEYGPAVAEFNIALMLALSRRLHRGYLQTLQNEFSLHGLLGRNLQGRTLGVVGAGNIGLKVLELAQPFGMTLLACDPEPCLAAVADIGLQYCELEELIRRSDVIALCCPLNAHTQHMIGRPQFEMMKRGVLLVNTSRGAVIDTQALLWALNEGIVEGAALDVLESETTLTQKGLLDALSNVPTGETTQSIAEDLTLMRHPKVLVTPHMAYYSSDSIESIQETTIKNLQTFFEGGQANRVA